jgi:phosphatidylserine/phosphatidylglycerophosphate/cardiolipin synthase-like enzyme
VKSLSEAVARIGLEVHPARIDALCTALGSATRNDVPTVFKKFLGACPQHLVDSVVVAVDSHPEISVSEISAMLRASAAAAAIVASASMTELVWTGPDTTIVPVRHTEQVLIGVLDEAMTNLFVVSFVAYEVPSVVAALKRASARNVGIKVLLEPSEKEGGRVAIDSIAKLQAILPDARFYVWQKTPDAVGGCVHAKCVVADARQAFITSANLTRAAMERNIEVGVLIRGGPLPIQLDDQLEALIETKQLKQL